MLIKIISGDQTGAGQAVLDFSIKHDISTADGYAYVEIEATAVRQTTLQPI